MSRGRQFRELLRHGGLTIATGAYDCITARLITQAGFAAVYMTGAGTAATLGYPDYGLLQSPGSHVAIDLETQTATGPDGAIDRFDIDPFRKECLLAGTDVFPLRSATASASRRSRMTMKPGFVGFEAT